MAEFNVTLGTARGDIAAFSSNSDFSPTIIKNMQSSTTANTITSAIRPEVIQLAFSLNSLGQARGNTSATDWGGLAIQVATTYQTVEG